MLIPDPKGYYRALGITRGASPAVVKRAFRSRAKQTHPDTGGDDAAFRVVTQAYEVLGNRKKRAAYDASCRAIAVSRQQASAKANRDVANRRAANDVGAAGPLDLFWLSHGRMCATASMLILGFLYGVLAAGPLAGLVIGSAVASTVWHAYSIATDRVEQAAAGLLFDEVPRSFRFGWETIKAILFAVAVVVYLSVIESLARTAPSWLELLVWFAWPLEWVASVLVPMPAWYQGAPNQGTEPHLMSAARHMFLAPWVLIGVFVVFQSLKAAPDFVLRRYAAAFEIARSPAGSNLAVGVIAVFSIATLLLVSQGFQELASQQVADLAEPTLSNFHDVAVTSFVVAIFGCYATLALFAAMLVLAIRASFHFGPGVDDQRVVVAVAAATPD